MGEENVDTELATLLDSALEDFGRSRNTDDELDVMMRTLDIKDSEKAAQRFDEVVKNLCDGKDPKISRTDSYLMTEEETKAAQNFQNMLKALIAAEEKSMQEHQESQDESNYDRAGAEAFIGQLKKLSEQEPTKLADESEVETLMGLIQTFFAKDLMYPPLKELLKKFPTFIDEHKELDAKTRQRYEKQVDLLRRICAEYDKEEPDNQEEMRMRFDTISTLLMELQSCGYPPEELCGEVPPGWAVDPETGLTKVDDVTKAAEACSIM